jgi:hypothetical protein
MIRSITKYIIWIAVFVVALIVLSKMDILPSWNIFKSSPLKIDDTPVLVKEINTIAELSTISVRDEVVVDSFIVDPAAVALRAITGLSTNPFGPAFPHLVIIAKGEVICGTNLKKFSDSAVKIFDDSVSIIIPRAEILDVIVNPSGFETFIEEGKWSDAAITAVKIKAREKLRNRTLSRGTLADADKRAVMLISNMLEALGYKKFSVQTSQVSKNL